MSKLPIYRQAKNQKSRISFIVIIPVVIFYNTGNFLFVLRGYWPKNILPDLQMEISGAD